MPTDERVLVIPAAHFAAVGAFVGFRPADEAYRRALLDPAAFAFRPRREVETDPDFLQLIPYVVLTRGGQVFRYRRGAAGTEARLRLLWSVGLGGHVSDADAAGEADPYRAGMLRELHEEVTVRSPVASERLLGFIYDPSTPVGRVHLGVAHVFAVDGDVTANEGAVADAGFAGLGDLIVDQERFETWSRFVIDELAGEG